MGGRKTPHHLSRRLARREQMSFKNNITTHFKVNWKAHFWGIFFLFTACAFSTQRGTHLENTKMLCYVVGILTFLFISPLRVSRVGIVFAILSVWAILTAIHSESLNVLVQYVCITMGFLNFLQLRDLTKRDFQLLQKYFIFSCLFFSVWVILERYQCWSFYDLFTPYRRVRHNTVWLPVKDMCRLYSMSNLVTGPLGNYGHTGILLAILSCFFMGKWKWLLPVPIWALVTISDLGTETPLFMLVIHFLLFLPRRWLLPLTPLAFMGIDVVLKNPRWKVFELLGKLSIKYPFGVGLGFVSDILPFQHPERFNKAHNEYLEALMVWGIPGTLLLLSIALAAFSGNWRNKTPYFHASVVALFSCLFWFTFHLPSTAFLTTLSLAFLSKYRTLE